MKVITLVENTSHREDLIAEHGLSLYIETEQHRILFDSGQSDAFAKNAEKLSVDLSQVDFVVLSHGHYDHGGGLKHFLELNDHAPVYMSTHAFGPHYNGSDKYIGLDPDLMTSDRLRFISETVSLHDGITLHCCETAQTPYPVNPFGLKRLEKGIFQDDDFRHEIYMTLEEKGNTILFSGCAHRGILNIANWFQPDVCFGGFHFSKLETVGPDAAVLDHAAKTLLQWPTRFYTGHCTGQRQYEYLKTIMGEQLHSLSCGVQIDL